MNDKVVKTSEIKVKVGLDQNNVPIDLKWMATDSEHQNLNDCKSINISIIPTFLFVTDGYNFRKSLIL